MTLRFAEAFPSPVKNLIADNFSILAHWLLIVPRSVDPSTIILLRMQRWVRLDSPPFKHPLALAIHYLAHLTPENAPSLPKLAQDPHAVSMQAS